MPTPTGKFDLSGFASISDLERLRAQVEANAKDIARHERILEGANGQLGLDEKLTKYADDKYSHNKGNYMQADMNLSALITREESERRSADADIRREFGEKLTENGEKMDEVKIDLKAFRTEVRSDFQSFRDEMKVLVVTIAKWGGGIAVGVPCLMFIANHILDKLGK